MLRGDTLRPRSNHDSSATNNHVAGRKDARDVEFGDVKMDQLLALRINDAARALGVGRTHLYRLINEGKIDTICLGRRRLVKAASLRKLIEEG